MSNESFVRRKGVKEFQWNEGIKEDDFYSDKRIRSHGG